MCALQQHGLLTSELPFRVTAAGTMRVCVANKVIQPACLLAKLNVPPSEQSRWQLLQSLLDSGWEAHVRNHKPCRKAPPFNILDDDARQALYLVQRPSGIVCSRFYLLALTYADQHKLPVPHGESNSVYLQILRGVPRLALPAPQQVRAFRAVTDGDDWLDHNPVHPPARKKATASGPRQESFASNSR